MKISSMIFISIIGLICSGATRFNFNKEKKSPSSIVKPILPFIDNYSFNYNDDNNSEDVHKIDVLYYGLFFDLHPEKKMFYASAEIKGVVKEKNLNTIDLNFYGNFDIKSVALNGKETNYTNKDKLISVDTDNSSLDTFLLKINYSGTPERVGFVGFAFGVIRDTSLVYNLSEPNYASSWFPCNDIPSDKALLDMRIENDSSKVSVSNGILVNVINKNERRIYHWKTIYPISTYLIAVYSSNYTHFKDSYISLDGRDTMSIDYYVLPGDVDKAKIDFKQHPDMIRFFAETFGEYPFIKEKYGVAEFLWQLGAMEHQTITGVATNMVSGKNYFLDVYAHELAHHWWGDAVGPKSWKDIWLNEGFATYSEALYFEFRSGKSALRSTMLDMKQRNFRGSLAEPRPFLFSSTVYDKGAWVLHMLRWEVGDKIFFKILRDYFNKYKYSIASTEDFENVCESVSGKDLTKFFDQWINGKGVIELKYDWKTEKNQTGKFDVKISLLQYQEGHEVYHFPLEFALKFDDGKEEIRKTLIISKVSNIKFVCDEKPADIILDPNDWLLMYAEKE